MPTLKIATSIVKRLKNAGHTAYIAGGWVRDFLMKRPSDDIDIATSASISEIQEIFPKTVPIGAAFGIILVVEEGHSFEVAMFRKESGYEDGRRPTQIEIATPEEDAKRRDFTINGMFYDPEKSIVLDYVGGEKDLKKGIIRAIGNPHTRFLEDRLRMMRAVRYSTRFGFPIESDTQQAILAHAKDLFPSVAMERVWQEFKKMSQFSHFDSGLVILHKLGLLSTIFPDLASVEALEIQTRVKNLPLFPKQTPTILELLHLFPDKSLQQALELCEYLKLSRKEKEWVSFFYHARHLTTLPWEVENYEWAQFYAHSFSDTVLEVISAQLSVNDRKTFLEEHVQKKHFLHEAIIRIRTQNPILRAADLEKEGIAEGKKMGVLLKLAERISVNDGIENREILLEKLKASKEWSS